MKLIIDIPNSEEILKKYHYHTADMVEDIRKGSLGDYGYQALYQQVREAVINEQFYIEKPKAKWISSGFWQEGIGMAEQYGNYFKCSNCGKEVKGSYKVCFDKFCSECGADMKGEDNDK